jgi:hypothetical protein
MVISGHWMACIWGLCAKLAPDSNFSWPILVDTFGQVTRVIECTVEVWPKLPSPQEPKLAKSPSGLYILSLYFSVMTICTVHFHTFIPSFPNNPIWFQRTQGGLWRPSPSQHDRAHCLHRYYVLWRNFMGIFHGHPHNGSIKSWSTAICLWSGSRQNTIQSISSWLPVCYNQTMDELNNMISDQNLPAELAIRIRT